MYVLEHSIGDLAIHFVTWILGGRNLLIHYTAIEGGSWAGGCNFCCVQKFLLKKCYKCRVGSKKSESRGVGWLIEPRSLLGGAFNTRCT